MADGVQLTASGRLAVEPILSYPHVAEVGKTYLLTVDLRPLALDAAWPYEEGPNSEECVVYCLLNSYPLFRNEPLGEPAIVLHRFGGSYGPARFVLRASDHPQEGVLQVKLVNQWGVPLTVLETPPIRVQARLVGDMQDSGLRLAPQNVSREAAPPEEPVHRRVAVDDYAIVIGIEHYPYLGTSLTGVDENARRFWEWLTSLEGGNLPPQNVTLLLCRISTLSGGVGLSVYPHREDVGNALRAPVQQAHGGKRIRRLYLYVSGFCLGRSLDDLALLMPDAAGERPSSSIPIMEYLRFFRESGLVELVFFVDCSSREGLGNPIISPSWRLPSTVEAMPPRTFYAYNISEQYRGQFTTALLDGLRGQAVDPQGRVTFSSLRDYVLERVRRLTREVLAPEPEFTTSGEIVIREGVAPPGVRVLISVPPEVHGEEFTLFDANVQPVFRGPLVQPETELFLAPGPYELQLERSRNRMPFQVIGGEEPVRIHLSDLPIERDTEKTSDVVAVSDAVIVPHEVSGSAVSLWVGAFYCQQPPSSLELQIDSLRSAIPLRAGAWQWFGRPHRLPDKGPIYYRRVVIDGLEPDRPYAVKLVKHSQILATATFRTMPVKLPVLGEAPFTLMVGSSYYQGNDRQGDVVHAFNSLPKQDQPAVKILCGNQVYLDAPWEHYLQHTHKVLELEEKFLQSYVQTWREVDASGIWGLGGLLKHGANYFTSGDHEYWNNAPNAATVIRDTWSSTGRQQWFDTARQLYQMFQTPGPLTTFAVGPLSFLIADIRSNRTADRTAFMRPTDLQVVEQWMQHLPGPGILVLGEPLFTEPAGRLQGTLANWQLPDYEQYATLVRVINDSRQPLVILAGQVNFGRVARCQLSSGAEVYEVISSPMSLVDPKARGNLDEPPTTFPPYTVAGVPQVPVEIVRRSDGKPVMTADEHFLTMNFWLQGSVVLIQLTYWPVRTQRELSTPIHTLTITLETDLSKQSRQGGTAEA